MALVEREEVLASLEDMLADAVTGRGKIAIVGGPVATGKTALLNTLVEDALEHGALPLTATCSQSESGLALAVLSQILHNAPLTPDEEERTRNLLHEGARCAMSADPLADYVDQVDAHIVHALCMVLLELAERHPLMIVVDDIQHADRASQLCLAYLARRLRFAHILASLRSSWRPSSGCRVRGSAGRVPASIPRPRSCAGGRRARTGTPPREAPLPRPV